MTKGLASNLRRRFSKRQPEKLTSEKRRLSNSSDMLNLPITIEEPVVEPRSKSISQIKTTKTVDGSNTSDGSNGDIKVKPGFV